MGFTPKQKLYQLHWPERSHWHGFEVTMQSIPIRDLIDLARKADAVADTSNVEDLSIIDDLQEFVATRIESWNLEIPEGCPVKPGTETLTDLEMTLAIIKGWTEALVDIDAPLEPTSTVGSQSVGLSIPMATLSEPLAS